MRTEPRVIEVWRLPLTPGAVIGEQVWAILSPQEQAHADRFRFPEDRVAYVSVHALLRLRLAGWLGQPAEALRFVSGPFGKPALQHSGPHFNLSHCRSMVCIAVSAHGAVGVDIEPLDRGRELDLAAMTPVVLTPAEQAQLGAGGWPLWWDFMRLWTLKEAVVKASGDGLSQDLHAFSIELHEDVPALWRLSARTGRTGPWHRETRVQLRQWCADAHALALAYMGAEPLQVVHHTLDLTELVRWATARTWQEKPP